MVYASAHVCACVWKPDGDMTISGVIYSWGAGLHIFVIIFIMLFYFITFYSFLIQYIFYLVFSSLNVSQNLPNSYPIQLHVLSPPSLSLSWKIPHNKGKNQKKKEKVPPHHTHTYTTWSRFCVGQLLLHLGSDLKCGWYI